MSIGLSLAEIGVLLYEPTNLFNKRKIQKRLHIEVVVLLFFY